MRIFTGYILWETFLSKHYIQYNRIALERTIVLAPLSTIGSTIANKFTSILQVPLYFMVILLCFSAQEVQNDDLSNRYCVHLLN